MQFPAQQTKAKPVPHANRSRLGRLARWGLAGMAALALLLGLFYAEEDWRGRRAWTAYERALKAKGVDLNWRTLEPPPVADGDNFAMTPFFAALFDYAPGTHTPRDMAAYTRTAGFAQTGEPYEDQRRGNDSPPAMWQRKKTDLTAAGKLFRKIKGQHTSGDTTSDGKDRTGTATVILEELAKFSPVLDELQAASRRPQSRFNFSYQEESTWRMPLPHLPVLKHTGIVLILRASAELALRNPSAAAQDTQLIITLANSIRGEPFQSSRWTRLDLLANARQIIWEGLADRLWSDGQLRNFQSRLQGQALLRDSSTALRLERGSVDELFGQLHRNPAMVANWRFGNGFWSGAAPYFFWLMPSGWMYQEQVSYHRLFEEKILPALNTEAARIQPELVNQAGQGGSVFWRHRLLANIFLQSMGPMLTGAALAQTGNDQTIMACALERYRLVNRKFPTTLDELCPEYLDTIPADVFTGQPMKYRRTEDGRFQLYSIGWNGKDDGGKVVMNKDGKAPDAAQGDWVWPQYPEE